MLKKFAVDSKAYRDIKSEEVCKMLQEDVFDLCNWSVDWDMLFNVKNVKSSILVLITHVTHII